MRMAECTDGSLSDELCIKHLCDQDVGTMGQVLAWQIHKVSVNTRKPCIYVASVCYWVRCMHWGQTRLFNRGESN